MKDPAVGRSGTPAKDEASLFGVMAEFDTAERILQAARRVHEDGYRHVDAFTPFPVEGLAEVIGFTREWLPSIALMGGVLGGIGGFVMQYYAAVIGSPLNVGGRPLNSWPSFVPITFELTVLGAALSAVLGMLALNWLPRPYHPVFNVPRFALASRDRFFLLIRADDPHFDRERTWQRLLELGASDLFEVEP
jgi:hypothetical protein